MIIDIVLVIILITLIYGFLIHKVIIQSKINKKILYVFSIFIFFLFIQFKYFDNLGYPVSEKLPDRFYLMHVYKTNDNQLILLVKDFDSNILPRLYKLKYSKKLEETLNNAMNDINKGLNILGVIDDKQSNNNYGIQFKSIEKQLPTK
ncbi:MAG: hypothetical protein CMD65_03085 [Gammaproteobacteria bacterium]|nr:hypothetical protein [Gammaproteobacteria bacterium]